MALTARDLYEAGLAAPTDSAPPANGSPRFRALVRRQVESLDWFRVPLRYSTSRRSGRIRRPARGAPPARAAARRRVLREWPRIRDEIDAGHPSVVGLIRAAGWSPCALTRNHQVLAYAYEKTPAAITIHVYDPNCPTAMT